MPATTRQRLAASVSPLLLFVWLRWPGPTASFSIGETVGQFICAYAMFFTAFGLAELVTANLAMRRAVARLGFAFLFAGILSISIRLGLMFSETGSISGSFTRELVNGFGDAFWCAAAIGLYRGWVGPGVDDLENRPAHH